MTITVEEARQIIADAEAKEQRDLEASKKAVKERIDKGWETATFSSIPTLVRYNFFKGKYKGWRVNKTNSHTKETNGMYYFVTRENILLQSGGGTYTLQNGILITPEEIEALNNGEVPERIRYNSDFVYADTQN